MTSNASSASKPASGQPVMFRTASPHAPAVVRPTAASRSKMSGTSCSRMKWSWTFWRVDSSAYPSPYPLEMSPIAWSASGEQIPPGILIRSM